MFKNLARNIAALLILTLAALTTPAIHASTTSASTAASTPVVTGSDPEPIEPGVVQTILVLLPLA